MHLHLLSRQGRFGFLSCKISQKWRIQKLRCLSFEVVLQRASTPLQKVGQNMGDL